MSDSDNAPPSASSLGRRGFLVMMGSAVLGRFLLPEVSGAGATAEAAAGAVAATGDVAAGAGSAPLDDRVRRVLLAPQWQDDFMIYVLDKEGADPEIRIWTFDDEAERAEARRFHDVCHWRSWHDHDELRALLATAESWLVRFNQLGHFGLLNTTDPELLFGPGDGEIYTEDPSEAATFDREQAFATIIRFSAQFGFDEEEHAYYFEPVQPADAMRDLRAERCGTA